MARKAHIDGESADMLQDENVRDKQPTSSLPDGHGLGRAPYRIQNKGSPEIHDDKAGADIDGDLPSPFSHHQVWEDICEAYWILLSLLIHGIFWLAWAGIVWVASLRCC